MGRKAVEKCENVPEYSCSEIRCHILSRSDAGLQRKDMKSISRAALSASLREHKVRSRIYESMNLVRGRV